MEKRYWEMFMESGNVMDYLYYRGLSICEQVMQRNAFGSLEKEETGERSIEPDNSYRNGA